MKTLIAFITLILAGSSFAETAPTEFVTQVLNPSAGKISRPKNWYYTEEHQGPFYTWTVSREEATRDHPYTTGVRIQVFTKIKDGTGKSPRQFILDIVTAKQKEATKILKTCQPKIEGNFTHLCLETEEGSDTAVTTANRGPHHILYSLYWCNNDLDMAVVTVSGSTPALWNIYAPAFEKMSGFDVVDLTRFEK